MSFFDYFFTVLTKFGGGAGGPPNEVVRFLLAAIFFAILLGVAWSRQRQGDFARERLLLWGFGLGLARELFMFTIVSLQISGNIDPARLELFFPPLEHLLRLVAVVFIAGAFLRFVLDDAPLARRYLQIGIGASVLAYLIIFWPWAQAVLADPAIRFGKHWGDWVDHGVGVILLATPIVLLARAQGWVRNVAMLAFSFFFLDDLLMLFNLASAEVYAPLYGPIRHNLHLWAIPLLGYVYFREQANDLHAAQSALQTYSAQLEEMVATRTAELEQRTAELEQQTIELARARDAAEVASHAKSEFLSNMNHELRSPLNAILGFTRISARHGELPQDVQENLGIILRSGEHLLTLINQVLDLAKIEAGHTALNLVEFDLHHLLATLEEMFGLTAEAKGIRLQVVQTGTAPRHVRADEVKLRQALINLLSNALKFTQRGSITLQVTAAGEAPVQAGPLAEIADDEAVTAIEVLRFAVIDTGPGIPAAEQERIFDKFAQTAIGQQIEGGTGLGLPISRNFVRLMGGRLSVESPVAPAPAALAADGNGSTAAGPGACFHFEIPVAVVAGKHSFTPGVRVEKQVVGLASDQPTFRILVVDDKQVNRQLLVKLLTPLGFAVREAANGQEALSAWEAWRPHLIWMDMRMPVMDGYEAATRIKSSTQGQATAVIALTASAYEEERAIVLSAGCDDFMRKPFREADIFAMMEQHLGVRFHYAESAPSPPAATQLAPAEIAQALNALPAELRTALKEAVAIADIEALDTVIDKIAPIHAPLAADLKQMAQSYDYAQIEQLWEQPPHG